MIICYTITIPSIRNSFL